MRRWMWWAVGVVLVAVGPLQAVEIVIEIENLAPQGGVYLTPVWVGFHGGQYDLLQLGEPIAPGGGLERLAEDGDPSVLRTEFAAAVANGVDGVIAAPGGFPSGGVFAPGEASQGRFELDPVQNRFMSFAAMVIPSNDAFIASWDPIEIFGPTGDFLGKQIVTVLGIEVLDAGTESNTEMDANFLNQTAPGQGLTTADPVLRHLGFIGSVANPSGTPVILGGSNDMGVFFDRVAADFKLENAVIARITIVPEPATALLLLGGCLALLRRRRAAA